MKPSDEAVRRAKNYRKAPERPGQKRDTVPLVADVLSCDVTLT